MFDGKEYTLTSSFFPESSFKNDSIEAIVHYDIHLMSISEAYYNYLKKIRGFSISLGDAFLDGLLEPTAVYSNVTDGFGVVIRFPHAALQCLSVIGRTCGTRLYPSD